MAKRLVRARFYVINPADETTLASVASATVDDAIAPIDAAHSAMKSWIAKRPCERANTKGSAV